MKARMFAIVLAATTTGISTASPPSALYGLTWQETFAGTAIDTSRWSFRTDSKALSTQLPANVVVRDNQLSLVMKKEAVRGKDYTGAGIISKRLFGYGYYEVTARTTTNKGWHNSFWMMAGDGSNTYGPGHYLEIDQFEINTTNPSAVTSGLIFWNGQPGPKWIKEDRCADVTSFDSSAGFHTYGADWREGAVDFYVDGVKYCTKAYQADTYRQDPVRIWLTAIAYRDPVTVGGTPQLYRNVRFYQRDYYVLSGHDGYTEAGGGWEPAQGGFGLMPQRKSCRQAAYATFAATLAQAGRYRVSLWNGPTGDDRAADVTITASGKTVRQHLNLADTRGTWVDLGVHNFRKGAGGQLSVRGSGGCVSASATKFVRLS
ncbi:family 16 glycosylhydrolase [Sphingomonas sp.]|uniref:family 16 glycosylhydrolase n=1 Tax=Sphingomonas sp. TaxID=28214 RepID=UPI003B3ABE85